jgi:error-prone DNA polymerase
MGWNNPPVPWREHERLLAGRAAEPVTDAPVSRRRRLPGATVERPEGDVTPYAELHAHSHFSFLDGASSPADLVAEAIGLGLRGLAVTDHDGLYGAPALAEAARMLRPSSGKPLPTMYGAELSLGLTGPQNGVADPEGEHLLVLARGVEGYHRLAGALTDAHLRGEQGERDAATKGRPRYDLGELAERAEGHWLVLTGCRKGFRSAEGVERLVDLFGAESVVVELTDRRTPGGDRVNDRLAALAGDLRLPTVATGNVHYARPEGHRLADAMAAIRARCSLAEMDGWLPPPTAYLRSGEEMARLFGRYPGAVARSVTLAEECAFDLRAATPRLPLWSIPAGHTPMSWLRHLTDEGFAERYAHLPHADEARVRIEDELDLIERKGFAGYFVIVHDIVAEARRRAILCQGRGSAASSAVCFALGITVIDSVRYRLPFQRFLSADREEEPDIDVDFDSDRREEIIQWVYDTYGRRNAAQVANVISYRPRMAVRDAAKALGYSPGQQDAWAKLVHNWTNVGEPDGVPDPVIALAGELLKAPRHLGIHSGGMVLTDRPIGEVVPIERARMERRTVLQWDKDACEYMGLVKFDLLGLGMLSALDHMMRIVGQRLEEHWTLATLPTEEPAVYDMLCRADSIGVFQVESRAQIGTLPRLRPREFYDLVIEIALIRPGPIQGGAVHPYIRRATGKEKPTYIHKDLEDYWVLGRTLGVPLFQEQLMKMAEVLARCTKGEIDLLRRAMGSKRGEERIEQLHDELIARMRKKGLTAQEAETTYQQILAFANFGFAESHALSFAKLVYASSWLKLHYPGAFLAGLLRAQPMGFYSPQSLVQDARRHGVEVRRPSLVRSGAVADLEPLDSEKLASGEPDRGVGSVSTSQFSEEDPRGTCLRDHSGRTDWIPGTPDPTPEHRRDGRYAVRLGLDSVRGIGKEVAERIVAARVQRPFADQLDLSRRAELEPRHLEALATAGVFEDAFGQGRREALWAAGWTEREGQIEGVDIAVPAPELPVMDDVQLMLSDLWATGVTPDGHPFGHIRERLRSYGIPAIADLPRYGAGRVLTVAGFVTHRQRPSTAGGVTFLNLEDETGMLNVVCLSDVWRKHRKIATSAAAMLVEGRLERVDGVTNLVALRLGSLEQIHPEAARALAARHRSRDFR